MLTSKPTWSSALPSAVVLLSLCLLPELAAKSPNEPFAKPEIYKNPKAPVESRVADLLNRFTLDEKIDMLGGQGFCLTEIPRLGVPALTMSDAGMGLRGAGKATAYANGVGLAATWDADLAQKVGVSMGRDSRARGIHFLLAPGMNLYRSPHCGRNFEYLGEDPVLAGQLASRFIQGVQSQGVCVTAKHLAGNEQEVDRHNLSSNIDERTLRELYLKPFEIVVRNGALGVMSSYNPLNGIHASQNEWLLNKVLKGEWGFRGLVMSDWNSCYDPLEMANGGLDLEMPHGSMFNKNKLAPLLEAGKISQATIDDKVRRILRVAFTLGWFDRAQKDPSIQLDDPASDAMALQGAREAITLLKNTNHLLPLDPAKVKNVVLLGRNADPSVMGGGGSSLVEPFHSVSVREGIIGLLGQNAKVTLVPWKRAVDQGETREPEAKDANGAEGSAPIPPEYVDAVKTADVVIVCVGFRQTPDFKYHDADPNKPDDEGEAADRFYELPPGQAETIKAAVELNPHTIVILNAGGSVATESWINKIPVLIHAYYPGQNGGTAIAEILFGKTNPSGKLPFSWEKKWEDCAAYGNYPEYSKKPYTNDYKEGVFLGYRWFDKKGIAPLFPFGFGMSYTSFSYSGLQVSRDAGQSYKVTAVLTNVGDRLGAEISQLYISPPDGKVPRPLRELKGFVRTSLAAKESRTISITFNRNDLGYWNPQSKTWTVAPGLYEVFLGSSSVNLPVHIMLRVP